MRRLVSWIVSVLILSSVLGGCGIGPGLRELFGNDDDPKPTSTVTPATFGQPLQLRPVTEIAQPPCASGLVAGADADQPSCYRLADETLTIERVKDLRTIYPNENNPQFGVQLTLYPDDAKAFGELTGRLAKEQAPKNQIAVVVDGKVVTAPAVMEAITGGDIQITGNFSRPDAEKLIEQLRS